MKSIGPFPYHDREEKEQVEAVARAPYLADTIGHHYQWWIASLESGEHTLPGFPQGSGGDNSSIQLLQFLEHAALELWSWGYARTRWSIIDKHLRQDLDGIRSLSNRGTRYLDTTLPKDLGIAWWRGRDRPDIHLNALQIVWIQAPQSFAYEFSPINNLRKFSTNEVHRYCERVLIDIGPTTTVAELTDIAYAVAESPQHESTCTHDTRIAAIIIKWWYVIQRIYRDVPHLDNFRGYILQTIRDKVALTFKDGTNQIPLPDCEKASWDYQHSTEVPRTFEWLHRNLEHQCPDELLIRPHELTVGERVRQGTLQPSEINHFPLSTIRFREVTPAPDNITGRKHPPGEHQHEPDPRRQRPN